MNISQIQSKTLKEIVTDNFQTAAVFEKFNLDFCCRGGKTIDQACTDKGINSQSVFNELSLVAQSDHGTSTRFEEWEPNVLIEYIVKNHHSYVRKMIPILYTHTQKIAKVHGSNHPEVIEIAKHFEAVAIELQQHMAKEEQMLFPFVASLYNSKKKNTPFIAPHFGTVRNPIRMMESEHQNAGDEMYSIRALSNGYAPPVDACTTYKVTYQEIQDFERDLHEHVHLENNILFPKAVALEQELISKK